MLHYKLTCAFMMRHTRVGKSTWVTWRRSGCITMEWQGTGKSSLIFLCFLTSNYVKLCVSLGEKLLKHICLPTRKHSGNVVSQNKHGQIFITRRYTTNIYREKMQIFLVWHPSETRVIFIYMLFCFYVRKTQSRCYIHWTVPPTYTTQERKHIKSYKKKLTFLTHDFRPTKIIISTHIS